MVGGNAPFCRMKRHISRCFYAGYCGENAGRACKKGQHRRFGRALPLLFHSRVAVALFCRFAGVARHKCAHKIAHMQHADLTALTHDAVIVGRVTFGNRDD